MKIEKLSENKIKFTLTAPDLRQRNIRLSELAYGSEKAKELFREMLIIAAERFNFHVENSPLIVEAIPVSVDALVLVFTRVENPDEIDVRFSRFTPLAQDADEDDDRDDFFKKTFRKMAEDFGVLGNPEDFENVSAEPEGAESGESEAEIFYPEEMNPEELGKNGRDEDLGDIWDVLKQNIKEQNTRERRRAAKAPGEGANFTFVFESIEKAAAFAVLIKNGFTGRSNLYKDPGSGKFFLVLHLDKLNAEEFRFIGEIGYEYASVIKNNSLTYFEEYFKKIVDGDAVERLLKVAQ